MREAELRLAETRRRAPWVVTAGVRRFEEGSDHALVFGVSVPLPAEYHAWPTLDSKPVALDSVDLEVELTRLGNKTDRFNFAPHADYLRGDGVVHEPHSFVVKVIARHDGKMHEWSFDSFEGRTTIGKEIAGEMTKNRKSSSS